MWLAFYKIDDGDWEQFAKKETREELIAFIKNCIREDSDKEISEDEIAASLENSPYQYIIVNEEDLISEIDLWNSK